MIINFIQNSIESIPNILVAAAIGVIILANLVKLVPASRVVITELNGHFNRILQPGIHIMIPLEQCKTVQWGCPIEDQTRGTTMQLSKMTQLPTQSIQLDVPPVSCLSADHILVSMNGTLTYLVLDPFKAAYETSNPISVMHDVLCVSIREFVSQCNAMELFGSDWKIGQKIAESINAEMEGDYGITCQKFLIQSIEIPRQILDAQEEIFTEIKRKQILLEQKKAEHEIEMQVLNQQQKQQELAIELQMKQLDADIHAQNAQKKLESEIAAFRLQIYLDAGFSHNQMVEMEKWRSLRIALSETNTKSLFFSSDFINSAKALDKDWETNSSTKFID